MFAKISTLLLTLGITLVGNSAAQTAVAKTDSASQVAQFVVHDILSSMANATVLFGPPKKCFDVEAALCNGQIFSSDASRQVGATVSVVAKSFSRNASEDPDAEARALIHAPAGDPKVSPKKWYHLCNASEYHDVGEVVIVRPSAVRESVPGSEWKMVVTVATYPRRGECYGDASAKEYVVAKAPGTASYTITRTVPLGGGTGRIK